MDGWMDVQNKYKENQNLVSFAFFSTIFSIQILFFCLLYFQSFRLMFFSLCVCLCLCAVLIQYSYYSISFLLQNQIKHHREKHIQGIDVPLSDCLSIYLSIELSNMLVLCDVQNR